MIQLTYHENVSNKQILVSLQLFSVKAMQSVHEQYVNCDIECY